MPHSPRDTALAELVRDRGEPLVRYAYLFTGDRAAAQDLLQDALVKVFVRTRSGFEPRTLEGYVRRAISTLYIDGFRKRATRSGRQHLFAGRDQIDGLEAGTVDRLDLRAALGTLARQERAVVVLRYFEDMTVPEIAQHMGLADGSVKRYLSNAVRKLEQTMGPVRPAATEAEASAVVLSTTTAPRQGRN